MRDLISRFETLPARLKALALTAAIAIVVLTALLIRGATTVPMALLYSGLEPAVAAEVLGAIEAEGIAHQVRGDAIYVAEPARDALRLRLAGQGLPASGGAGYELLDTLSGFGTTSQMFDAAFRRAQEGELARTIAAAPAIRSARVHLSQVEDTPFRRGGGATASVTVTMASGPISVERARAIRHLVASAVPDMVPQNVSIIDAQAGQVIRDETEDPARDASDRAAMLRANVLRLLEARVGPGRAFVEVNVETVTDSETVTERVIDPDSRVAIHTDVEEDLEEATGNGPGPVTVASNLPDGDAAAEGNSSSRELTRTRERVNYEVSEVLRERVSAPGRVARVSVAVLVDGVVATGAGGAREWTPRSPEEIDALADLVRAAVGFDAARGDVLTIESMEFPATAELGTLADAPPLVGGTLSISLLVQLGVLLLAVLALGLFVLRPILSPRRAEELAVIGPLTELPAPDEPTRISDEMLRLDNMPQGAEADLPETPLGRLRGAVTDRRSDSVELLRNWIDADLMEGLQR